MKKSIIALFASALVVSGVSAQTSEEKRGGILALGNGATNTGMNDFWSYNPANDSWFRIADFIDPRNSSSAFSLNNYGYITGGSNVGGSNGNECWRYDPNLNIWEKEESLNLRGIGDHFSFILNVVSVCFI